MDIQPLYYPIVKVGRSSTSIHPDVSKIYLLIVYPQKYWRSSFSVSSPWNLPQTNGSADCSSAGHWLIFR